MIFKLLVKLVENESVATRGLSKIVLFLIKAIKWFGGGGTRLYFIDEYIKPSASLCKRDISFRQKYQGENFKAERTSKVVAAFYYFSN